MLVAIPEVRMSRILTRILTASALFLAAALAGAQSAETAIRTAMDAQVAAWNRGDIPAFMAAYEDSPDTTFIGTQLRKGFEPILKRYQQSYSNSEQMGTLTFTDLDVRMLPSSCGETEYAVVTGKFHLQRTAHGEAAKDDGIFSLVWRKGPHGWKIVVDHTS
jgi:ketosteroid isomerase-like protein